MACPDDGFFGPWPCPQVSLPSLQLQKDFLKALHVTILCWDAQQQNLFMGMQRSHMLHLLKVGSEGLEAGHMHQGDMR